MHDHFAFRAPGWATSAFSTPPPAALQGLAALWGLPVNNCTSAQTAAQRTWTWQPCVAVGRDPRAGQRCGSRLFAGCRTHTVAADWRARAAQDVTVRLAQAYGYCWGVERAVQMAYEARKQYPGAKLHVTNEIIHNPAVNQARPRGPAARGRPPCQGRTCSRRQAVKRLRMRPTARAAAQPPCSASRVHAACFGYHHGCACGLSVHSSCSENGVQAVCLCTATAAPAG